jgi:hypothetical protein
MDLRDSPQKYTTKGFGKFSKPTNTAETGTAPVVVTTTAPVAYVTQETTQAYPAQPMYPPVQSQSEMRGGSAMSTINNAPNTSGSASNSAMMYPGGSTQQASYPHTPMYNAPATYPPAMSTYPATQSYPAPAQAPAPAQVHVQMGYPAAPPQAQ